MKINLLKIFVGGILMCFICLPVYPQLGSVAKTLGKSVVKKSVKQSVKAETKVVGHHAVADAVAKQMVKRGLREQLTQRLGKEGFKSFFEYGNKRLVSKAAKTRSSVVTQKMIHSNYKSLLKGGGNSKSSPMQMAKNMTSSAKKKFESTYLKSQLPKTLIYKRLQQIKAKGPIKLKKKEFDYLMQNADKANLKSIIKAYTGNENGFLEFFIRLADGDKKQVAQILEQPNIRSYINSAIRSAKGGGGYHEWLMTKNFEGFLLDEKWGKDGDFLAIALTELTQKTSNVNFKIGGGHPSSGRPNSSLSAKFHNGLAEVIDQCNTKEELFVNIRAYAKEVLTEDAYKDFNEIFKSVVQTTVK